MTIAGEFVVTVEPTEHAHHAYDENGSSLFEYEDDGEHYSHHRYVIWTCVLTAISLVSLACSVTLLVKLLRDRVVLTTKRILFLTSTVNDIVLLTLYAAIFGPLHLMLEGNFIYECVSLVSYMGFLSLYNVSVCLLLAIVVHQYLDVMKKSLFLRHVTEHNVRVFLVLMYVACALYRVPYFFEFGFAGSGYVVYLEHSFAGAFPIYVLVSIVTCELLLPFPAMVFITVRLHRATAKLPDTDVNVDGTSVLAPLSSVKSLTRLVVLFSIVGVACLPLYPILHVYQRMFMLGVSDYESLAHEVIFSFILLYPSSKLLIYLAVTRGYTRGSCLRCRTLSSVTSSSSSPCGHVINGGVVQDQPDTVVFLSNDDRCALVNTDELSHATQK